MAISDKKVTWYGGGIYSKPHTDRDGRSFSTFFVRVWIPSKKKNIVWKAGRTLNSAKRLSRKLLADPEKAALERQQQAEQETINLTVGQLYKNFTANYRGRGGTDFYISVLRSMVATLGKVRVSDLTMQKFDAYIQKRKSERTKGGRPRIGKSTLRKEIIAASTMIKWGRQRGYVTCDPLRDYKRPEEPEGAPARALTYEEEDRVLALLPPLERDIVCWCLDSGMRIGEVLALTWPRIDRAAGVIHVVGTKTGRLRTVPLDLSDRLSEILGRHPQRIGADLLFHDRDGKPVDRDRINKILKSAMKAAGVPKVRGALWNVLRKTWVSRLYASGKVMPQQEADWGGHSMAVATRHYREYSQAARGGAEGVLNRTGTVTRTVTTKSEIS